MLSALVLAALLAETPAKPLPESTRLIADVRAHQKHMDELRENSAFRELVTTDELTLAEPCAEPPPRNARSFRQRAPVI